MIDCLKLDDNNFLVTFEDDSIKLVCPQDELDRFTLIIQSELSEINKDIIMCKSLIEEMHEDNYKEIFKCIPICAINILDFCLIEETIKVLPAFEPISLIMELSMAYLCIQMLISKIKYFGKLNYINLENMMHNLEQKYRKKENEMKNLIIAKKVKADSKRKVEEFFYTDSDLKQIEANIAKSKKHPE